MGFANRSCSAVLCLALTLWISPVFAADFTVQLPVQENVAVPAAKDDFYLHVNGAWLKTTEIPADDGEYSTTYVIEKRAREQLMAITQESVQKRQQDKANADEARVADFYACIVDQKGRDAVGLGKLAEPLHRIEAVKTTQEYAEVMADIKRTYGQDGGMVGDFDILNDPQENNRYVVFLLEPSTGLGRERMGNDADAVYQGYYRDYMRNLLVLYGRSPAAAEKTAADIFALEKDIALHSLTVGEMNDPSKSLHRLKLEDLKTLYSHLDITAVLNHAGIGPEAGVQDWYVCDIAAISRFNELCTAANLTTLKEQAIVALLAGNAPMLTTAYQKAGDQFSREMRGAVADRSVELKMEELNERILSNTYGRLYAERYFSREKRVMVTGYLKLILENYKRKLADLDWMSEATKQQAIAKLDHIAIHVGAPTAWPAYLDQCHAVRPEQGGSLIDNVIALRQLKAADDRNRLGKPVRKDLWEEMQPQVANAFYDPQKNSINFSAAILQAPFFDVKMDQATNLGGIGAVMAHEITHCFDTVGAHFDEQGRLHNWWSEQDYAEFKKRQADVIKFYDRYVLLNGTRLNGTQTMVENIADLGALSCLSDIIGPNPANLRLMYTNYAIIWQSKLSDAMLQDYLADAHSLPYVRVDAVLSSTDGFYKAYDVQPGDGMYVAPEERARLW